ncbi:hypothetical protein [Kitasatospora purpeofusca]|uniref:NucA/NucB deoxyribonuclease domain-containing protein n=1 Tax=Kitasatospora purpeofusca TaxID=67352 RepID=UPI002A5A2538|nr:hypothetical protein [Kitasatospora purpeofusca]MDY0811457.1 hypothetical protein [Kitasatospora purpeofusca]
MKLRTLATAAAAAALIVSGIGTADASPEKPVAPSAASVQTTTKEKANSPAPKPGRPQALAATSECAPVVEGRTSCLTVTTPHAGLKPTNAQEVPTAVQALQIPKWCIDHAYQGVYGLRNEACEVNGLTFTTYRITNGTRTVTGEAQMNVINYEFTDKGGPTWAHQIEVSAYLGWGDAITATVEGTASASGSCNRANATFPAQGLSPTGSWRIGEAYYGTTATAPGAIGFCTTNWQLTFRAAGYDPATANYGRDNVRCDNATGGNPYTGCVVPWYPSPAFYRQANTPELARHVSLAQASGLPGATFEAPLTRTTDPAVSGPNRTMACGDAPSIPDKSCDEYPLATSRQGLTAGGTRRTFDNCSFGLPQQSGPTGVSVCMISRNEQDSQGGTMSQFYRWERVLDGDPFRVLVIA